MPPMLRFVRLTVVSFLILTQAAAFSAPAVVAPERGTLLESTLIASYSREELDASLQSAALKARNGIPLYDSSMSWFMELLQP